MQPPKLTIESERNFENSYNINIMDLHFISRIVKGGCNVMLLIAFQIPKFIIGRVWIIKTSPGLSGKPMILFSEYCKP